MAAIYGAEGKNFMDGWYSKIVRAAVGHGIGLLCHHESN
jgi:hypothetical protein